MLIYSAIFNGAWVNLHKYAYLYAFNEKIY